MITYFHNPKCSKSRQGLQLLSESSLSFKVQSYLTNIPKKSQITHIVTHYKGNLSNLIREPLPANLNSEEIKIYLIKTLFHSPEKIQRPILMSLNNVCIGRPIEKIASFIREYKS